MWNDRRLPISYTQSDIYWQYQLLHLLSGFLLLTPTTQKCTHCFMAPRWCAVNQQLDVPRTIGCTPTDSI